MDLFEMANFAKEQPEVLQEIKDELEPVVDLALKFIKEFAGKIEPVLGQYYEYQLSQRIKGINTLTNAGLSRDQAISVTNNIYSANVNSIRSAAKGYK